MLAQQLALGHSAHAVAYQYSPATHRKTDCYSNLVYYQQWKRLWSEPYQELVADEYGAVHVTFVMCLSNVSAVSSVTPRSLTASENLTWAPATKTPDVLETCLSRRLVPKITASVFVGLSSSAFSVNYRETSVAHCYMPF